MARKSWGHPKEEPRLSQEVPETLVKPKDLRDYGRLPEPGGDAEGGEEQREREEDRVFLTLSPGEEVQHDLPLVLLEAPQRAVCEDGVELDHGGQNRSKAPPRGRASGQSREEPARDPPREKAVHLVVELPYPGVVEALELKRAHSGG